MADYRLGVGIVLLNHEGKVFVGKRNDMDTAAWQLPQGGIDEGENPNEAVLRELFEETGIKDAEIVAETGDWLCYDFPDWLKEKAFKGKYKGQKQKWFLLKIKDKATPVVDLTVHEPEFSSFMWVEPFLLPNLAVEFKKQVYEQVLEEFAPLIASLRG